MNMKIYYYISIGFFIFCIDRITKYMAIAFLTDQTIQVNKFLSFELVINRGISWGMFHSDNPIIFFLLSIFIAFVTLFACIQAYSFFQKGISILGHVFVVVGSASNLIDRLCYSGVIDFIVTSYQSYYWPVFNCADIAIVVGLFLISLQADTNS